MKRTLAILAMGLLLAACGKPEQTAAVAPATDMPASATTAPATPAAVPVPKGVDELGQLDLLPPFETAVAYDIVDKDKTGKPRHRVLFEVLAPDMNAAIAQMDAHLVEKGYVKSKDGPKAGGVEQVFKKPGAPTMVLLMQAADRGPKLKNASATGSIHIMWNIH
jgi:hypothetical protein